MQLFYWFAWVFFENDRSSMFLKDIIQYTYISSKKITEEIHNIYYTNLTFLYLDFLFIVYTYILELISFVRDPNKWEGITQLFAIKKTKWLM